MEWYKQYLYPMEYSQQSKVFPQFLVYFSKTQVDTNCFNQVLCKYY